MRTDHEEFSVWLYDVIQESDALLASYLKHKAKGGTDVDTSLLEHDIKTLNLVRDKYLQMEQ